MRAFSLVELSIVLVILGLLTGGILAGQSLIRASELRAVTTEYQRWLTATQTFRDKYFAIPGDMTNATRFWGDNNSHCADAAIANGVPGTCNGDGDGELEEGAAATTGEIFQFWNQLALASLIEGAYTGITGTPGAWNSTIGINVPKSRMANAGWSVDHQATGGSGTAYALIYGNYFMFGAPETNTWTGGAILKPEEAWNIDSKLDDGKPAHGKVVARYWNNACAAADDGVHANDDYAASYKVSDNSAQCSLFFRQLF